MKEIWKDYIYNYQISNFGRIRNKVTNKTLKLRLNKNGYLDVCISLGKRNKKKLIKIHQAVAECFVSNPHNYKEINHIDGNKINNLYSNLEWCTHQYNTQHAYKNNLINQENKLVKIEYIEINQIFNSIEDLIDYIIQNNLTKTKNRVNIRRCINKCLNRYNHKYCNMTLRRVA